MISTLTKVMITAAQEYNGARYPSSRQLPFPWCLFSANTWQFVTVTARFQKIAGLTVDGQFGPLSLTAASITGATTSLLPPPADAEIENLPYALPTQASYPDNTFVTRPRVKPVTHIVIHESVGATVDGCKRTLQANDYGVHYAIGPDGQHHKFVNPATHSTGHGGKLNSVSIGIEIISPYTAGTAKQKPPFDVQMAAEWWTWIPTGSTPFYRLPTVAQMLTLARLVNALLDAFPTIPRSFPTLTTLNARHPKVEGWHGGAVPPPGIVAHADYSNHADSRFPLGFIAPMVSTPDLFGKDLLKLTRQPS